MGRPPTHHAYSGVGQHLEGAATPIHRQIAQLRAARRLTQAELAALAGCSRTHLACIESGARQGSPAVIQRLAEALGATVQLVLDDKLGTP